MIAAFGERFGVALYAAIVDVSRIGNEEDASHYALLIHQRLVAEPDSGRARGFGTSYKRTVVFNMQLHLGALFPPGGGLGRKRAPRQLDLAQPLEQFPIRVEINAVAAIVRMGEREDHAAERGNPF